jgi:hypothetical protein
MSEPIEVEVRFGEDGHMTVLSFMWRGRKRPVLSHGRQWGDEDGFHFLLMTTGDQVYELVYAPLSSLWHIAGNPTNGPRRA